MKTFFTVSVLAACALAADVKDDIEDFFENAGRAIEELLEDPEDILDQFAEDVGRSVEDVVEGVIEEAECWYADRNDGDGECAQRDRDALMDMCYRTDGMTWDWQKRECITLEQNIENEALRCLEESGTWKNYADCEGMWCGYCYTGTPQQQCEETGGAFDWDTEQCFESWEEMEAVRSAREEIECIEEGGCWMTFHEWDSYFQCYRGEPSQDCEIADKYWDWDNEKCYTWQEQEINQCVQDGYDWIAEEGWSADEGYCNRPSKICEMCGGIWDWQTETCMTMDEWDRKVCADNGMEWIEGDWPYCNWSLKRVIERIPAQHRAKALASIEIDMDLTNLEEIGATIEEGEKEGEELIMQVEADVEATLESWAPVLAEWEQAQELKEMQAFMDLANVVVDSVNLDGISIREILGNPEDWFMARNPRKAKSIRSLVVMQEIQDLGEADHEWVYIEFTGPSEQELNEWLAGINAAAESIGNQAEKIANDYAEKFEDLADDFGYEMEYVVGEPATELVDSIGDDVKAVVETAEVLFYDDYSHDYYFGDDTEDDAEWDDLVQLARKQEQHAAASSNAGMYAGISFGVIGLVAAGAMFAAYNKKQVAANEESLL